MRDGLKVTREMVEETVRARLPERNPIVITTGPLIGLGDIAVYSTLPQRFTELGYDVYYDSDNHASNEGIFDLFWERNPYVKGPSDLKPNAGYVNQGLFYEIANRLRGYRSIEAMERAHGLPPPYGMAPKIYYTPKPHLLTEKLKNSILVDFSAASSVRHPDRVREHLRMAAGIYRGELPFLQVVHNPTVVLAQEYVVDSVYAATSVFDYIDMIAASRAWLGSEAGGQSLASAIRGEFDVYDDSDPERLDVICMINKGTFNTRGYTYRNVDYRVTTYDSIPDFHFPHEVEVHKYAVTCAYRGLGMRARKDADA
jgi:hypothetical protein